MTEEPKTDQNPIPGLVAKALNNPAQPETTLGRHGLPLSMDSEELEALYGEDHPSAPESRLPHDLIFVKATGHYLRRPCYGVHDRCPKCRCYTYHSIDGTCHNHEGRKDLSKPPK